MSGTIFYRAIALVPRLVDAHWHKHCLFIIQNNPSSAMTVLDTILGLNRRHTKAYRSKYVNTRLTHVCTTTYVCSTKFDRWKSLTKCRNSQQFVKNFPINLFLSMYICICFESYCQVLLFSIND